MYNQLTEKTADYNALFDIPGSETMPITGNKHQIVHTFQDGRTAVVNLSNSFFEAEVKFNYLSDTDREFILDFYHNTAKANGGANTFNWQHPRDGNVYVVRFLTPLRTVYKPGLLQSIETIRMRVDGIFGDHEHIIDLGDLHLATVDNGAMFFHDTEDFSAYAGASGNTPFRIVFTDSGGLTAEAWCGEVGGGLALGDELVTNGNFSAWTGDDPDGWSIGGVQDAGTKITEDPAGSCRMISDGDYIRLYQEILAEGELYELQLIIDAISGTLRWPTIGYTETTIGTKQRYYTTPVSPYNITRNGGALDCTLSSTSVKKVTDIPTTGLKLYSTKNGTTRSMGTTDAGFNPNTIVKVDIYG